jgi:nucleoside-diphosphate-sugar epimerase
MTILVTGAAGFIGSHVAQRLEQDLRTRLVLVDDFSRGKKEYLKYLGVTTKCDEMDLRDPDMAYVATLGVDTVYHTACRIGGMQFLHGSPEAELNALQDNLLIDTNLFKACIENGVKRIVFTSSVSVYNTEYQYASDNATFKETDFGHLKFSPEGGYGYAKALAEKQLSWLSDMGIKVGIARIFKSYGACDDYSEESGQVVCSLFRKALTQNHLDVWGSGEVKRCLLYIDDLIDGLIRLAKWDGSLTVNLGAKEQTKISELAKLVVKTTGKKMPIVYNVTHSEGPLSRIPDLTRAKEMLGWEPTTPLDIGLRKTLEWMKTQELNDS